MIMENKGRVAHRVGAESNDMEKHVVVTMDMCVFVQADIEKLIIARFER
jgi:hypothetical protein